MKAGLLRRDPFKVKAGLRQRGPLKVTAGLLQRGPLKTRVLSRDRWQDPAADLTKTNPRQTLALAPRAQDDLIAVF